MANSHSVLFSSGSSQYASVTDDAALSITGDISIECWIKPASFGSQGILVSKWNATGQFSYILRLLATKDFKFDYSSDGNAADRTEVTTAEVLDDTELNTWIHIAVTADVSAQDVKFYKNGIQLTSESAVGSDTAIFDGTAAFAIGCQFSSGSPVTFFDGKMDDVRLWNDIRTGTEILNNYQTELVGDEAGLVGYWKLNNDYTDETANANTLTASGSPTFTTDIPFPVFAGNILFIN